MVKSPLPIPEIFEENKLSLSFKQPKRESEFLRRRPPKLHPKYEASFNRSLNVSAHAVSFREGSTNSSSGLCHLYNESKRESYYEQCFEQISKIGEGSFGEVFKVRSLEDGCMYAVKKSKEFFRGENYRQERLEEVRRIEEFSDHEHCVTLYKAWEQEDRLFMQMELCKESLEKYSVDHKRIPEEKIWSFLLDLLLAVKSLHDRNLIHLDIKLDNILVTDDEMCKLADFGLVFDLNSKNFEHATEGDSRYIAPELLQGKYSKAADIFSLGIAILELTCNLDLPTNGLLWQKLRCGYLPDEIASFLSPELQQVIKWMMHPAPELRPSVDILLNYPTINSLLQKRLKWTFIRKIKKFMWRKLCNLKLFLSSLLLCITSCLTLRHSKRFSIDNMRIPLINRPVNVDESFGINGSNDDLNITPTLNNSIPSHTPSIRIVNSTPLNHHNGFRVSFRQQRAESSLRNLSFESADDDLSFSSDVNCNHSQHDGHRMSNGHNDSYLTKKKLFFKASDDSD